MGNDDGIDWSSPKAIYGVMLTIITTASGGYSYHQSQHADPRPDPFTGAEGRKLDERIDDISNAFAYFVERGPADVRAGQKAIQADHKETSARLARMESYLVACTARGTMLKAQLNELEALVRQLQKEQRDHFRKSQ